MKKGPLLALILFAMVLLLPIGVKLYEGQSQLSIGRAALERGEINEGIYALGRSVRAVLPLSPFPSQAEATLLQLGEELEAKGNSQLALLAYSTCREGLLGSRQLLDMRAGNLEKTNAHLARLYAGFEGSAWPDPNLDFKKREAVALARLESSHAPSRWLALLGGLAFLGWIAGAIQGVRHGFLDDGTLLAKPAMFYGSLTVVSLAVFFVAMRLA